MKVGLISLGCPKNLEAVACPPLREKIAVVTVR